MRSSVESVRAGTYGSAGGQGFLAKLNGKQMGMGQNLVPLVNIKIAGKWMFIPLKMVLIGIDPYPNESWINHGMNTSNSDHATRSPCCLGISSLESMVMFKLMKLREANNILH